MFSLSKSMPGFRYDPTKGKFRSYLKTVVMHAISKKACQNGVASTAYQMWAASRCPSGEGGYFFAQWEAQWRQYYLRAEPSSSKSSRPSIRTWSSGPRTGGTRLGGEEVKAVAEALIMSASTTSTSG